MCFPFKNKKRYSSENIESEMSERDLKELRKVFNKFDRRSSGMVSTEQMGAMFSMVDPKSTQDEVNELLYQTGLSGFSSEVSFPTFVELVKYKRQSIPQNVISDAEFQEAFEVFDTDGNGNISADELQIVMTAFGFHLREDKIKSIVEKADADGDGLINFSEFKQLVFIISKMESVMQKIAMKST